MTILIDSQTRVLVQGITGVQARTDTENCLRYGTRVVAGVTPGRGGEKVLGVPVFDTVRQAVECTGADTTVIYAPPSRARSAALEALEAGLGLLVVIAEHVPRHDVMEVVARARRAKVRLVGCNTNGLISPGHCKLGGIGGSSPDEIYVPGRIGVCSRSGGMSAELALTLRAAGFGISTCVSMGGDALTGLGMADYARLFEADPATDAIVVFGEPGTRNEQDLACLMAAGGVRKPVVALLAGEFQERHPAGMSFGHAAAIITDPDSSVSGKRRLLQRAGVLVASTLEQVPAMLYESGIAPTT